MELANLVNPWILFFTCTHISMIPTNYPLLGSESRKIILLREKAYQSFKGNAQCIYFLENMDMPAALLRLGYIDVLWKRILQVISFLVAEIILHKKGHYCVH